LTLRAKIVIDHLLTNQGTVYVFANVYMYPEVPGTIGKIKKYDVLTGKTLWEIPDPYPNWGGTGSGVGKKWQRSGSGCSSPRGRCVLVPSLKSCGMTSLHCS